EPAGAGSFKVTGDLTLHGVSKEVVLDVSDVTPPIKDPMGKTRAGAHATTKINRKDYGVNWSKVMDNGGVMVGDDVAITIDGGATRQGAVEPVPTTGPRSSSAPGSSRSARCRRRRRSSRWR